MKLHQIQDPPGVKDMVTLLEFLGDPKRYAEHLAGMQKLKDDLNIRIGKLGTARDIESLRAQATTDRKLASELVKKGRAEAVEKNKELDLMRGRMEAEIAASKNARRQSEMEIRKYTNLRGDLEKHKAKADEELGKKLALAAHAKEKAEAVRRDFEGKLKTLKEQVLAV